MTSPIVVGETDAKFIFNFKVENIKVLPGTYEVVVSKKLSFFTSTNQNLCYYALEPDSTFNEWKEWKVIEALLPRRVRKTEFFVLWNVPMVLFSIWQYSYKLSIEYRREAIQYGLH